MIKPLNDYVALQPIEEERVTASGIYLGSTQNKQPMGKVVDAGVPYVVNGDLCASFKTPMSNVKVGDVVWYKNAIEIKDGDKVYILVKRTDLLAVLDRGEE